MLGRLAGRRAQAEAGSRDCQRFRERCGRGSHGWRAAIAFRCEEGDKYKFRPAAGAPSSFASPRRQDQRGSFLWLAAARRPLRFKNGTIVKQTPDRCAARPEASGTCGVAPTEPGYPFCVDGGRRETERKHPTETYIDAHGLILFRSPTLPAPTRSRAARASDILRPLPPRSPFAVDL